MFPPQFKVQRVPLVWHNIDLNFKCSRKKNPIPNRLNAIIYDASSCAKAHWLIYIFEMIINSFQFDV